MNDRTALVLKSLRNNAEGCTTVEEGHTWRDVYLDNVMLADMSAHAFAGHLAQLERAGLYRPGADDDGVFGVVRTTD